MNAAEIKSAINDSPVWPVNRRNLLAVLNGYRAQAKAEAATKKKTWLVDDLRNIQSARRALAALRAMRASA